VDVDEPGRDQNWDRRSRSETETERLDRNWATLLQELRVVQTGVQLLTGFLLTLPFQARFEQISSPMRMVYLVTVACSLISTVLLAAPVSIHRVLFRRHRLGSLVAAAHRYTLVGMVFLGLALTGVAVVVFDAVQGPRAGMVAGGCTAAVLLCFWVVLPLSMRVGHGKPPQE
jgi:hypothetical protein